MINRSYGMFVSAFLTASLWCGAAAAAQIDRIEIVEYGLYKAELSESVPADNTATGSWKKIQNIARVEATDWVPASVGTLFGFAYTIVGSPIGERVPLRVKTIYPAPGMTNPGTGVVRTYGDYTVHLRVGDSDFRGYAFEEDWELVPGEWMIQLYVEGRKLAEKSFVVR